MVPLSLAKVGDEGIIQRISGDTEVKAHLQDLGFVKGASLKVISVLNGNLIVTVKDTRLGISFQMAKQIYI